MNDAPDRDVVVFSEALHLPAAERAEYLDRACASDGELRRRVEVILQSYEKAGDFLQEPAAGVPATNREEILAGENPGDRVGRYKLLHQIGEGGWGVVYMAEQEESVRRLVALKVIKPGMDTKSVIARFEAERQALANGLALDVQRYLASEAISARPPSKLYKLQKAALRHKLLFLGIGVIALLLVLGLIIVSASLAKEHESRREADAALKQAEADKAKAQTEAVKSQQVTQFLENMLQGVGPSVALGQDTTMLRGILDRTAERVGQEMTNQPAIEAELRNLIGRVYFEIGIYDQAEKMHRAALAIRRELFGPEREETVGSLNDLGVALWRQEKLAEAESAHREALAIRLRLFGNEHADVAISLNNLADVYRHYQRPAEGEPLAREALRIRRHIFGNDSLEAAKSLRVLSILLGDEGKPAEAETMAREVLAIRRKLLRPEDPLVPGSLADIAWAAGKQGKWQEVEALQREAFAMQLKLLGDGHPAAILSLRNLCATLEGQGKYADAEIFHREALAFWTHRAGREGPQALTHLEALARDLMAEKKFGEAEQLLDDALTPAFVGQPSSADVLGLRFNLMARRGRWQEAASDAAPLIEHRPAEHYYYHALAPLLAMTHDRPAYEKLCRRVLATFATTTNAHVADRTAQDCLLLPDSGVDLRLVDKLADTAVSADTGEVLTTHRVLTLNTWF